MTNNRALVLSDGILGGTFIDWSLMFLAGVTTFYNPINNITSQISFDPLTKSNAHSHNKIHPISFNSMVQAINNISSYSEFYSMYPIIDQSVVQYKNNITSTYTALNTIAKHKYQQYVTEHKLKTCHVVESEEHRLYYFFNRGRPYGLSPSEVLPEFYATHFNKPYNTPWEFRELTALSIRPFNIPPRIRLELPDSLLFVLPFATILGELDLAMPSLLMFFGINYNTIRFDHWRKVYQSWKEIHNTSFYLNWKDISTAIVNGSNMDLTVYRKELIHDVFLQHIMLYKYNLNIKGYGLNSLPMLTSDIHLLLEENFHPLDKDYQDYVKSI